MSQYRFRPLDGESFSKQNNATWEGVVDIVSVP